MKRRILILTLILFFIAAPLPRVWAGESFPDFGTGDNLSCQGGGDPYELTISKIDSAGPGSMDVYYYEKDVWDAFPWAGVRSIVERVTLEEGVIDIAPSAFCDMPELYLVLLPSTVYYIGPGAFANSFVTVVHFNGTEAQLEEIKSISMDGNEDFWQASIYCLNREEITCDFKGEDSLVLQGPEPVGYQQDAHAVDGGLYVAATTDNTIELVDVTNDSQGFYYRYDLDKDGTADIKLIYDISHPDQTDTITLEKLPTCSVHRIFEVNISEQAREYLMSDDKDYCSKITLDLRRNIENASITGPDDQTYTGSALAPAPVIRFGKDTLVKGTDYTVSYTQNTNVGTASMTITGKGNCFGSIKKTFQILPKSITPSVLLSETSYVYDGKAHKPTVTVKDGSKTLAAGKDYTLTVEEGTKVGTYKARVQLKNNYKGSAEATFTIKAASLKEAKVKLSKTKVTYNGKYRTPSTTVTLGGLTLVKNKDYTVKYADHKNAGTATVTITGKGNYTGTAKATFTIAKKAQPMQAKAKTVSVKYAKVKKAKQTIKIAKAVTIKKAKGTLTYTKKSGSKYLSINKKNGKITVKKGTPKDTYKIKIKITAAGDQNYKKGSKTVTVKIKVK